MVSRKSKPEDSASNRIRTDDLHITSVAPYQLGHRSKTARCDVVTKRYDLYFGSCDHIGVQCYSGVFISCDHVRRSARGRPVPRNLV